jgi:hypothetical protein
MASLARRIERNANAHQQRPRTLAPGMAPETIRRLPCPKCGTVNNAQECFVFHITAPLQVGTGELVDKGFLCHNPQCMSPISILDPLVTAGE